MNDPSFCFVLLCVLFFFFLGYDWAVVCEKEVVAAVVAREVLWGSVDDV